MTSDEIKDVLHRKFGINPHGAPHLTAKRPNKTKTAHILKFEVDDESEREKCLYSRTTKSEDYITIYPKWEGDIAINSISGISIRPKDKYHMNSNQSRFPSYNEYNIGSPSKTKFGLAIIVENEGGLCSLLIRIGRLSPDVADPDILGDIHDVEARSRALGSTQRKALIDARLGQGRFRRNLLDRWGGRCAVTGFGVEALLRASHIKPWHRSTDEERLDPENGLLLVLNLDAAFDRGLITFGDDGRMVVSEKLPPNHAQEYGLHDGMALPLPLPDRTRDYLKRHRELHNFPNADG